MKTPLPRGNPGGGGWKLGEMSYIPPLTPHRLQGRSAALSMIASYITRCESTMFVYVRIVVVQY